MLIAGKIMITDYDYILRMPTMGKIGKKWCFSRPKVAQDS